MNPNLRCAVCLYELETGTTRRLIPADAITIANGHAVCADHFQSICRKVSTTAGQFALAMLLETGFDRA